MTIDFCFSYDAQDPANAPGGSYVDNWYCSWCGAHGFPPRGEQYDSTLEDRMRAHRVCRCSSMPLAGRDKATPTFNLRYVKVRGYVNGY